MRSWVPSEKLWKFLLCAVLLCFGGLTALGFGTWQRGMNPAISGTLGFDIAIPNDSTGYRIIAIEDYSPLKQYGAKAGDHVIFDNPGDAGRGWMGTDETVGLVLEDGVSRRHVNITPVPWVPHFAPAVAATFYLQGAATQVLMLVLTALIGLRLPSSPSARMLALALATGATDFFVNTLPGGALQTFCYVFINSASFVVGYLAFLRLAWLFPHDAPERQPAWIKRFWFPWVALFAAYFAVRVANRYGIPVMPVAADYAGRFLAISSVLLSAGGLIHAFRHSTGVQRQRVQWIALSLGTTYANYLLNNTPLPQLIPSEIYSTVQTTMLTLANIGMAYAVLRHRVFDLGFAINRALVYGVVSVALLVSFGLAEWLAHHFISFEETEKSVVLDGAIALGLYLAFHQLKHKVEHFVERLFFHKWHQNEARLRRFVVQATHITSPQALIDAYLAALQRFTGNAGFAFYRRTGGSGYMLAASAGMTAPPRTGLDDALAVCLRAELAPAMPPDAGSSLPGALALPMSFRGELHGFLLLGQKTNHAAYRPDEIEVLAYSAHQISLDLHALQTEQLQTEVSDLRQEIGMLNKTIEFAKQAGLIRQGPAEQVLAVK